MTGIIVSTCHASVCVLYLSVCPWVRESLCVSLLGEAGDMEGQLQKIVGERQGKVTCKRLV